jgi:hypothetical protein
MSGTLYIIGKKHTKSTKFRFSDISKTPSSGNTLSSSSEGLGVEGWGLRGVLSPEAGISKNYCATNSGSPEVELRFCLWIILFNYELGSLT